MSRIGKYPVSIPQGVTVEVAGQTITAKGKLGTLKLPLSGEVSAAVQDGKVVVKPKHETKRARVHWGTTRALVNNMVAGVSKGFTKNLVLQLGYSHDVIFPIPSDIKITCEKPTSITVTGADRQRVGQTAAVIRAFRKPEPYKRKGIKYRDEHIRRKEGKKK